jgi:hypothetical protein
MTEMQSLDFTRLMKRLAVIFRLRAEEGDFAALAGSYFRALQRFELRDLERGADAWIQTQQRFPKPAEWRGAIPARTVEVPFLSDDQAREQLRAEGLGYEDAPCRCPDCLAAGVNEKPLRFVPEERQGKIGERIVTVGHWAHGFELFRWYDARANFYNHCVELGLRGDVLIPKAKRQNFAQRMAAIFSPKDVQP